MKHCKETGPTKETLSRNLEKYRTMAGFASRAAVERALGWPAKRYENYEIGRAAPPFTALWDLSRLFGVTVDELLGNNEENTSVERPGTEPLSKQRIRSVLLRAIEENATADDVINALDGLLNLLRQMN